LTGEQRGRLLVTVVGLVALSVAVVAVTALFPVTVAPVACLRRCGRRTLSLSPALVVRIVAFLLASVLVS